MENNLQVNIFCIQKSDEFKTCSEKYSKLISKYATLKEINVFNKKIALAQKFKCHRSKKSYEEAFMPYKKAIVSLLMKKGKILQV